jgi:hypothetical protein
MKPLLACSGGGVYAETSQGAAKIPHFARAEANMIARRPLFSG